MHGFKDDNSVPLNIDWCLDSSPSARALFNAGLYHSLTQYLVLQTMTGLLKRGKNKERGLCPLSNKLPSPAWNNQQQTAVVLAGEGSGVRLILPAERKHNQRYVLSML